MVIVVVRQFGILPDLQVEAGLRADQQDQQADDGRQHRAADENIGEGAQRRRSLQPRQSGSWPEAAPSVSMRDAACPAAA